VFIKFGQGYRSEIDLVIAVIDRFESDQFTHEDFAEKEVSAFPPELAAGPDFSNGHVIVHYHLE
jgi:hypothetical protein